MKDATVFIISQLIMVVHRDAKSDPILRGEEKEGEENKMFSSP